MKQCNKCDEDAVNSNLCRTHYNAKMNDYMKARYERRRLEWINKLGGRCVVCGTTDQLNFDHIIASTKEYDLAKILSGGSNAKVAAEMAKCQLLCHKDHVKKSLEFKDVKVVEHGGGVSGKKNCLCDLCKPVKNAYARKWKKNKKLNNASLV